MQKPPPKLSDVLSKIHDSIKQGKYAFTKHALDRVIERGIDIPTTINVLLTGYEEKKKQNLIKKAIAGSMRSEE